MRVRIIAGVVAALLVGFVVLLATRDAQRNSPSRAIVGEVAPAIAGTSYDGRTFSLDAELAARRWVVVNFFATWCPPCIRENPELVSFTETHSPQDVTLVGVAVNDPVEDVAAFFAERGGDWPVVVGDETNTIIVEYGVTAPPTTVLIAPSGIVADVIFGEITAAVLDARLAAAGFVA